MKNIFLDCGSHHLEGLSNFLENGIIDDSHERFMPQITQDYKSGLISGIKERDIKLTIWM